MKKLLIAVCLLIVAVESRAETYCVNTDTNQDFLIPKLEEHYNKTADIIVKEGVDFYLETLKLKRESDLLSTLTDEFKEVAYQNRSAICAAYGGC